MPMSDERSRLIEAAEELEKAKKLRRNLNKTKEWVQNIFVGLLALVFLGGVLFLIAYPWISGIGWLSITFVLIGGSAIGWNYLNWKADKQIEEAERVKSRAMWRD